MPKSGLRCLNRGKKSEPLVKDRTSDIARRERQFIRRLSNAVTMAIELHPLPILPRDDPEPVMLDFMQPRLPEGGWAADVGRHGATKPAGKRRGHNDMDEAR